MNTHLANTLESMGHAVTRFYYSDSVNEFYGLKRRKERIKKNIDLLNTAKALQHRHTLDLIFCYIYDDFLFRKYAKALSNLNIPMVNYNVDMAFHWYRQIRIAKYFDIMLCAQKENMRNLARYAKKVFYFPMAACPPQPNDFSTQQKKEYELTFTGTEFPYRRRILSEVIKSSLPLLIFGKCWGSNESNVYTHSIQKTLHYILFYAWSRFRAGELKSLWEVLLNRFHCAAKKKENISISKKFIRGGLSTNNLSTVFRNSKINIGLSRYANNDVNMPGHCQMRLRDFEVPMIGGFYLVEKSPGYDQAFIDGKEVVMWKTLPELLEKIRYYLKHADERESIAAAGQRRALTEHTWETRFKMLFSELGLQNMRF